MSTSGSFIERKTLFTSFPIPGNSFLLSDEEKEDLLMFKSVSDDGKETDVTYMEALEIAGTGYFQYYLTFVCGLINMSCSVSSAVMGFILPATKCKLHIMSHERGMIISSGLVGMVIGTFFWGALADTKGRKATLLMCFAIESLAAICTAFCYHKYMLLLVRFFNGFGSIGASSLVFVYASDFIVPKYKDYFLSALEGFWGIGLIYIPLVGLLIFPNVNKGFLNVYSWNIFAILCAIPAVTSFLLLIFLPESPAFLVFQGRRDKTAAVLNKIFKRNHRTRRNRFIPIKPESEEHIQHRLSITDYIREIAYEKKKLFQGKNLSRILTVCSISILVNFSFLTISIWIPTLLDRHDYEKQVNDKEMTFCNAAMQVGEALEQNAPCVEGISTEVFKLTILISSFILPLTGLLFVTLNYIGKNELLILLTVIAGVSCLFLNVVETKPQIIVCCIFFLPTADLIETVLFLFGVHLFPPQLCALALALIVISGRAAAVVGNSMFGALVDKHCYFPMYLFECSIFLAVIIELFLPRIESFD